MEADNSRIRNLAAYLICLAFLLLGAALFLRYMLGLLLPFLIAWALALAVRPLSARIGRFTRIPNHILRLLVLLLLFACLSVGLWLGGMRLFREAERLLARLTEEGAVERLGDGVRAVLSRLPLPAAAIENYTARFLDETVGAIVSVLPGFIGKTVSSVPRIFISAVITLIASVYFSLDLEKIHAAILTLTPARHRPRLLKSAQWIEHIASTYVRAYLTLMVITAALLFLGFLVIGVEYALLLAFFIALVDLFPVLGVGTVLVPWSIWCFLMDNPARGIALLVLWGVAFPVRQFAEPRILGGSLGVHPLLTLLFMYIGLGLFGVGGMLLAPTLAVPLAAFVKKAQKTPTDF